MTFFSYRLVTTPELPSSDIVLSSVLCKFGHTKFFFYSAVTPGWCYLGQSAPRTHPSPLVTSLDMVLTGHAEAAIQMYTGSSIEDEAWLFYAEISSAAPLIFTEGSAKFYSV